MKSTKWTYIIGVAGAISWGISYIGTKTALDYIDPIQVMAARMTIALITFGVFILIGFIKLDIKGKPIKNILILSISQPCLYGVLEIWGIDLTTASESAIILSMAPIAVTVLSVLFFKEKIRLITVGFVILSFLGVIITGLGNISTSGKVLGYVFLLLAVITAAGYTMLSKHTSDSFGPIEMTFVMTAVGFVFFNGLNFIMGYGVETYTMMIQIPELLYAILFLGIICSAFAFIAYNHLIATVPAYKASTLTLSLLTVTGVISGVAFRGDPLTAYIVIGLIFILTGVIGASRPEKLVK